MKRTVIPIFGMALAMAFSLPSLAQTKYPSPPEATLQAGVVAGKLEKYELRPGRFYPGTPHQYAVYTPAGYDGREKLPVMIFLDGISSALPALEPTVIMDNLIAKGEIPKMVALFIDPGVHPTRSEQSQSRFERHFEYDWISDRYASFLVEELLPEVSKRYAISDNPDARAIAGISTGAVGAFAAAWNRPDQFRRVMSFIGTYVSMKGAHSLSALVRKTEPKPIRVFMQAGKLDHLTPLQPFGTRYAGSWPINNQVMYEALQFAGYDVKFEFGDAGHETTHGRAVLPDAMRWLWRDFPAPITVTKLPAYFGKPGSEDRGHVFAVINGERTWEKVGDRYGKISSMANDRQGNVFFADEPSGSIYRVSQGDGKVSLFAKNQGSNLALTVGGDGRLYVGQAVKKRIVSYGTTASDERLVAKNVMPASLAATASGRLYFVERKNNSIARIDSDGVIRTAHSGNGIYLPSGLALTPDQEFLVVADSQGKFAWSFHIAENGELQDGEPYYRLEMPELELHSDAKAVTVNSDGHFYFATPLGIQGFEGAGRQGQILNSPIRGGVSAVTFAGGDSQWLYAAVDGQLFRRSVKVKAVTADTKIKPPAPPL